MVDVTCAGCDAPITQHPRARNPKKWCSETCRTRVWAEKNPRRIAAHRNAQAARAKALTLDRNAVQRCTVCGDEFASRWPRKYCSDPCKFRAAHVARYAVKKNADRVAYNLADVFRAASCGICQNALDPTLVYPDPMSSSLDHIVPLSRGGIDSAENVQAAHLVCNQRKGARVT